MTIAEIAENNAELAENIFVREVVQLNIQIERLLMMAGSLGLDIDAINNRVESETKIAVSNMKFAEGKSK